MQDLLDLNLRLARFWFAAVEAQANAATTIGFRMPAVARAMTSSGPPSAEAKRMVSEKTQAVMSGATGAGAAMMKGGLSAFGLGPVAAANFALSVGEAAMRPAQRRVKANARRLGRKALVGAL
jgi:hypothetical protein